MNFMPEDLRWINGESSILLSCSNIIGQLEKENGCYIFTYNDVLKSSLLFEACDEKNVKDYINSRIACLKELVQDLSYDEDYQFAGISWIEIAECLKIDVSSWEESELEYIILTYLKNNKKFKCMVMKFVKTILKDICNNSEYKSVYKKMLDIKTFDAFYTTFTRMMTTMSF